METPFARISAPEQATLDFEEIIWDIDESINGFKGNSNSNLISDDPNEINGEMTMLMDVPIIVADVTQVERDLVTDKSESVIQSESLSDGGFQIGWTDGDRDKKGGKSGSNKKGNRARGRNKQLLAEAVPIQDSLLKQNGPTKSTWTRTARKPNQSKNHVLEVMGPKRKNDYQPQNVEDGLVHDKKIKGNDESKPACFLMDSQVILAEVAMQPCREQ